jgi:hypothetical protein
VDLSSDLPITEPFIQVKLTNRIRKNAFKVLYALSFVNVGWINNEELDFLCRLDGECPEMPLTVVGVTDIDTLILSRRHVLRV